MLEYAPCRRKWKWQRSGMLTGDRTHGQAATEHFSKPNRNNAVLLLRGEKVLLDSDLAEMYSVTTKALNQAVKRNRSRFPADFMFRLTQAETHELNRSQTVTGSQKHRDPALPTLCLYRAGRRHAFQRTA